MRRHSFTYRGDAEGFQQSEAGTIEVFVKNDGRRPTSIPQVGFILSDECRVSAPVPDAKQRLDEGQTLTQTFEASDLIRHIKQHPFGTLISAIYAGLPGEEKKVRQVSLQDIDSVGLREAFGWMPGELHSGHGHPANFPPFRKKPTREGLVTGIPSQCVACGKHVTKGERVVIAFDGDVQRIHHEACHPAVVSAAIEALYGPAMESNLSSESISESKRGGRVRGRDVTTRHSRTESPRLGRD